MLVQPMSYELTLPWHPNEEQERAFKNALINILGPLLILFLLIPWLPVFEKEYVEPEQERIVTKVLLKPKKVDPIVPVKPKALPQVQAQPKVKPKPLPQAKAKAPPVDRKKSIRQSQGLNELSSQLNALRGSIDLAKLQNKNVSTNTKGEVQTSARQLLGQDQAIETSGGIEVDEAVMKNTAVDLAAYQATEVDGFVEGSVPTSSRSGYFSAQQGRRDMESIRRTLEQAKSSVYSLYQRALRDNPDLAGKFVFKLVIEPNGAISGLSLVASELGLSELEASILARIRQVNFGARDVSPTPIEYKFIFLPS